VPSGAVDVAARQPYPDTSPSEMPKSALPVPDMLTVFEARKTCPWP
jgi:hypothetical protein